MKWILTFALFISCSAAIMAWNPPDQAGGFSQNSIQITVSTNTSSPSKLLDSEPYSQRNYIINSSSFSIAISSVSTGISTTTSMAIPPAFIVSGGTLPYTFSPDGLNSPYSGQLFGVATGNSPPKITVIRVK